MRQLENNMNTELRYRWDPRSKEIMDQLYNGIADQILRDMIRRLGQARMVRPDMITDEDEIEAFKWVKVSEAYKYPEPVKSLKYAFEEKYVMEIEADMNEKGRNFTPNDGQIPFLCVLSLKHPSQRVKDKAKQMLAKINTILEEDIGAKYKMTTPLKHVSPEEREILRRILVNPTSRSDSRFDPVFLRLYWLQIDEEVEQLDQEIQEYRANPRGFVVDDKLKRKLNAMKYSAPNVRAKAEHFMQILKRDGKISRYQRR